MPDEERSRLEVLVELVDQATEPLRELHESFESFESDVWGLAYAFGSVFLANELFEHLIEPAAEFQEVQTRLALATGASAEQLQKFKEQAEELSQKFPATIEDLTSAQTELYQTFRNTEDVEHGTEVAAKLATVLGVDAKQGADILTSAVQNLGSHSRSVTENMDTLADKITVMQRSFPQGASGAARMATELGRLGLAAQQNHLKQDQVFAVWAELNRLHVGGARGAGQFANSLIEAMTRVDEHGGSELEKYGAKLVYFDQAHTRLNIIATLDELAKKSPAALAAITSHLTGAGEAVSALVGHMDDLKGAYGDVVNSQGALGVDSDKLAGTHKASMKEFENAVTNLADAVGSKLVPDLDKIVDVLNRVTAGVNKFGQNHPGLLTLTAHFLGIAAGAITLFGTLGFVGKAFEFIVGWGGRLLGLHSIFGLLGDAWAAASLVFEGGIGAIGGALGLLFESNPVGWVLTLVAVLVFGAYEIWKHWDKVKKIFHAVVDAIRHAGAAVANFAAAHPALAVAVGAVVPGAIPALAAAAAANSAAAHPAPAAAAVAQPAGAAGLGASRSQTTHVHYMEGAQINVGDTHGADVGAAIQQQLHGHADDLASKLEEAQWHNTRVSFRDTTLAAPGGSF